MNPTREFAIGEVPHRNAHIMPEARKPFLKRNSLIGTSKRPSSRHPKHVDKCANPHVSAAKSTRINTSPWPAGPAFPSPRDQQLAFSHRYGEARRVRPSHNLTVRGRPSNSARVKQLAATYPFLDDCGKSSRQGSIVAFQIEFKVQSEAPRVPIRGAHE